MPMDQAKQSRDGSLNQLAASIASKLARNAVVPADPQPSMPQEGASFSQRQDTKIFPSQGAETVVQDQPPRSSTRISQCLSKLGELGHTSSENGDGDHFPVYRYGTVWFDATRTEVLVSAQSHPLRPSKPRSFGGAFP
jgi:hypothetical protein